MPVCRFFRDHGDCCEQECVFKHSNKDIKECNMYNMGFCPNGPYCRYRHVKQPGPPPPVEEIFQKLQQMNLFNYGSSNRFYQHRGNSYNQQGEKPQVQHGSVPHNQSLAASATPVVQQSAVQHVQTVNPQLVPSPQQQQQQASSKMLRSKVPLMADLTKLLQLQTPFHKGNLGLCKGYFESWLLRRRGGNWKYAHGTPLWSENFSLRWLKAVLIAAETKEEEGKANGVNADEAADKQGMLLFDDREEEVSGEKDCNNGQATKENGRGRRAMWRQPHMPILRGAGSMMLLLLFWRSLLDAWETGLRGFPLTPKY